MLHRAFPEDVDLPHRPLPRQGVGREPARVPLRQLDARAGLEPQLHLQHPDHHGRGRSASEAAASSTRASARCATSCRTTCCRSWPCSPWSRPPAPTRRARATRRSSCSARSAPFDPSDVVRGQYRGYSDEDGVRAGSDAETFVALPASRSTRGAGPACRGCIRTGKALAVDRHRGGRRVQRAAAPALHAPTARRCPTRTTCGSGSGKNDGIMLHLHAKAPGDELVTQAGRPRGDLRARCSARAKRPTSGCSRTRWTATARRFGRDDTLDRAVADRRAVLEHPIPCTSTPRARGVPRPQRAPLSRRTAAAGTNRSS